MTTQQQVQTIKSEDMALGTLFNDFYVVPNYQREYVWEEDQVEQLLEDIHTEFSSVGPHSSAEYFIGSIVVCPGDDDVLELIDGQQRMTTTYLFLCVLRDYLLSHGQSVPQQLGIQIAATSTDDLGNDIFRHRVSLQYPDSRGLLTAIADQAVDLAAIEETTRSIKNIKAAYQLIRGYLEQHFGDNVQSLKQFYAFFTRRVKLIRIRTQSVTHALKVFETINERGKGLDSMDLLKNLMFMHANASEFETLKDLWKELVDTLYAGREKPLRFLRYFIFATYDNVDRLPEDEIYAWFVKNEPVCGYKAKPVAFVKDLLAAAKAYTNFLNGRDVKGLPNRYLENIRYLSGSARYHLILLLTARHLPIPLFTELCRHVENLFFAYIITREPTREFERNFAHWTDALKDVTTSEQLDEFVVAKFEPAKQTLSERFDLAFRGLHTGGLQKYRMRYVLAKLTQYVNEHAYGNVGAATSLTTFINSKVDVEHILPQSLTSKVLAEFDAPDQAKQYVSRLGNLVLLRSLSTHHSATNLSRRSAQSMRIRNFCLPRTSLRRLSSA
jgi:hypothetical protein